MLFFNRQNKQSEVSAMDSEEDSSNDDQNKFDISCFTQIKATLKSQKERLQLLAGSTENEFLAIGARLFDLQKRTVEIGDASTTVTSLTGSDEIREAIREVRVLIDRISGFLNIVEEETEQNSMALRKTLQMIDGVDESLAGFKKIMKVLHVLGISTKIESSRLGQLGAGFHNLADDVKNLAVQINDKSTRIREENVSLSSKITQTLAQMIDIEACQREDVHLVLDKTIFNLEMITGVHRNCAEVAEAVTTASGEISRNISDVVTSMQFHDITRQQLEHVEETLDDLEHQLLSAQTSNIGTQRTSVTGTEMAGKVYGVCRVQSAQLIHARDGITTAVSGIIESLNAIADKERGIARKTREIIKVADGAEDSIFFEIEKSLTPIVELLVKSASANVNLSRAVSSVAETVGEISTFVSDIESIGEEIKLIALNSQIKAAHTGDEGAALGVLAEAIQRLSVDACAQTVTVTGTLREITHVTETLSGNVTAEKHTEELNTEVLASHLKDLINSIRSINDVVVKNLEQNDAAVQELSTDIDSAISGIMVHGVFNTEIESITTELEQIMKQMLLIVPEAAASANQVALSERYTMNSERKIHASFSSAGVVDLAEPVTTYIETLSSAEIGDGGSELGDNIELF